MHASLDKLKSIAHFLKVSGRFNFQNYNLPIFLDFLKKDPEIGVIINNLLNKYPGIKKYAKEAITNENAKPKFDSFERWVAFCIFYIEELGPNQGDRVISHFIINAYQKEDNEGYSPKMQFYNDCIEPIIIYIELQIKHSLNALIIFGRYKVLCEWYDRESIFKLKEVDITKNHLSKFLFNQGFTYCLSETNVPSGRIDNFAVNLGLKTEELVCLPDIVVAEGKIFDGKKRDIMDVGIQVQKRIDELNLTEGYCVVFNKTEKQIRISDSEGSINGFNYVNLKNKRLYFIIINLDEIFYESKSKIEEMSVNVKNYATKNLSRK